MFGCERRAIACASRRMRALSCAPVAPGALLARSIDHAHAACADGTLEFVAADAPVRWKQPDRIRVRTHELGNQRPARSADEQMRLHLWDALRWQAALHERKEIVVRDASHDAPRSLRSCGGVQ